MSVQHITECSTLHKVCVYVYADECYVNLQKNGNVLCSDNESISAGKARNNSS